MSSKPWTLPERATDKPRISGITMIIDNGYPTAYFADVIASHARFIDYVKFGWGTALVTRDIERKIAVLREHGVDFLLGGTFFEACVIGGRLDDFVATYRRLGATHMEISNGTIDLDNDAKAEYIRRFSDEFRILSEVGYKDTERSLELHPARWVDYIRQDLDAGAARVITEARESGSSGICRADGELRFGLIAEITATIPVDDLIFEAPNKSLQVYFVRRYGSNVNLANVAFSDVVALETLRNGLRSDTLLHFRGPQGSE